MKGSVGRGTTLALGLSAALALGGCASMSKGDCLAGNWYERGYEDADGGESADRLQSHAKACAKVSVAPDAAVYARGYEAGLVDYCTPERGYRLGADDREYRDICPVGTEADFERALTERAAIFKGQSAKKADAEVDAARNRMDQLRGDRLGIREKIRRWNAELSSL